ncbi:DEAD/DEAH box helicase [Verrucomicrobiota bacterium sgz303538]
MNSLLQSLTIPDIWQQEAVRALRDGRDVVVHAPTGAGKTYIFELLYPQLKGQAVFTVPTRALANDKLAEWRTKGWDVGIATGDVAERLDARAVVATLETQKGRFLRREGPSILVIDEYQMIGDPVRGVNYELAIALAPPRTQLLLLSGSVANPHNVVEWLQRIGRDAVLVSHAERPVPLEEVDLQVLPNRAPSTTRGWWPRVITNALRAELGPILLFAPRRNAAEDLAQQLASALPAADPLRLTPEQEALAGTRLGKLLKARVAFHHSGLSYAQRALLVEPLAKRGDLRVVVATMGLAAGINFSMRSVAVTGTRYMAGAFERTVQPDELLQMYGRAGRRGLDESGYALVTEAPRLLDARARHLRRSQQVDWPTLVAVMQGAVLAGREPFASALELNERLFTTQKIPLGIEHSFTTGAMPCGFWVDMERARFARRGVVEIFNSLGKWETRGAAAVASTLENAWIWEPAHKEKVKKGDAAHSTGTIPHPPVSSTSPAPEPAVTKGRWRPALSFASTLEGIGAGSLVRLETKGGPRIYGRELVLGTRRPDGTLALSPWLKRKMATPRVDLAALETKVLSRIPELTDGGRLVNLFPRGEQLIAHLSYGSRPIQAWVDSQGRALVDPPERRELPEPCRGCEIRDQHALEHAHAGRPCPELQWCLDVEIQASPAYAWRRLGLIEPHGTPTRRGIIFSFFQNGEGLAIAAALEDESYTMEDLIFDLANLRAGPRFSGDDSPYSGRLAIRCQQTYSRADLTGYLEMGVPGDYGAGASEAMREIFEHGTPRQKLLTESLRMGDLERALLEWRSLLRHITYAPDHPWERWRELKRAAGTRLEELERT